MVRGWVQGGAICALAVVVASCGGQNLTPPTTPTPVPQTEVFNGTIGVNGAATHTFNTQAGGTVSARLTGLEPTTATVGFSLGTWNGVTCAIVIANDNAALNSIVTGTVSAVGTLCIRVYDVGKLTGPTGYEFAVLHP